MTRNIQYPSPPLPRISLFLVLYTVACVAGFLALIVLANRDAGGLASWLVNSLGLLYGTLLYGSGMAGFYVVFRVVGRSCSISDVAGAIPFIFIPTLIGLVGLIHGYISIFSVLYSQPSYPRPVELLDGHSVALACPLVGLCFTTLSFTALATRLLWHTSAFRRKEGG